MLEKSFGLLFFIKAKVDEQDVSRTIKLRITVDKVPKEFSINRKWVRSRWNVDTGRAIGNQEDARELNQYLDTVAGKIYHFKTLLLNLGRPITALALKKMLLGQDDESPKKYIMQVFRDHNKKMEALVPQEFAPGTLERYETSYRHTLEFMKLKYGVEDMDITLLNYEFIYEYSHFLKTVRKCAHNSTMKYLANFKKIVLFCVKSEWLRNDPFALFSLKKKRIKKKPLTQYELDRIRSKVFSTERLMLIRDMFIFACYTGLAYSDVRKLKRSELLVGIDGKLWMKTVRQKTDGDSGMPLLYPALEILNRYEDHPLVIQRGTALPIPTNQKVNEYLKEIMVLCEISKNLTFHIARHTFATTVMLTNDVPLKTVSVILGHASVTQTEDYAVIVDTKVSNDIANLELKIKPPMIIAPATVSASNFLIRKIDEPTKKRAV